jgi:hypothetical protein
MTELSEGTGEDFSVVGGIFVDVGEFVNVAVVVEEGVAGSNLWAEVVVTERLFCGTGNVVGLTFSVGDSVDV